MVNAPNGSHQFSPQSSHKCDEMEIQILVEIKAFEAVKKGMASSLARAYANRTRSPSNVPESSIVRAQIHRMKAEIAAISHSTAVQIHALALLSEGFKHAYVMQHIGLSDRVLLRLKKKTFKCSF
jgi:hypothetical protein